MRGGRRVERDGVESESNVKGEKGKESEKRDRREGEESERRAKGEGKKSEKRVKGE
jgi:hypothetical protein